MMSPTSTFLVLLYAVLNLFTAFPYSYPFFLLTGSHISHLSCNFTSGKCWIFSWGRAWLVNNKGWEINICRWLLIFWSMQFMLFLEQESYSNFDVLLFIRVSAKFRNRNQSTTHIESHLIQIKVNIVSLIRFLGLIKL
jgi:hypothetical protein